MDLSNYLKLYIVLETEMLKLPLEKFLREVLKAGVKTIQLRNKFQSAEEKLKIAPVIKNMVLEYNGLFIVNDSAELAVTAEADGVHLSYKDDNIKEVKEKYPHLITGYSCNNLDDVLIANKYADYAGIGPFTATSTKKDHRQILGLKGISQIHGSLNIPAVAIGGIDLSNAKDVISSGVEGLAISSYLCASSKPYDDALKLLEIINERV